ncbi:hypothetical protein O5J82_09075 [Corynebacterium glutamicum]|uniref:hypothetical protein n=1 Tax=Corynebacterium glutamicum TaxID=1718 RepID=UPI0022BA51AB|nr:hypothetical protein [Corynebacterium glutamicum]WBG76146.1 hypothetical protein O5J82_09075 [Corynebacterium glutamicum]
MYPKTGRAGKPVHYHWRYNCSDNHIEETVEKIMDILKRKYVFNMLTEADAEALIEDRLELAERGRLTPEEHVKSISSQPQLDMFEIRWNDIFVRDQDPVSGIYSDGYSILMRLYYVEKSGCDWFLGLHAHEKEINTDDTITKHRQNTEIEIAVKLWDELSADGSPVD